MVLSVKARRQVTLVWLGIIWVLVEGLAFIFDQVLKDPMASAKIPYPHRILMTVVQEAGPLISAVMTTYSRAIMGFGIGATVGILLAIGMSMSRLLEKMAFPYLIMSQMIPVLGLAPIIFNIVRDMDLSRIVIAAYITFFPVSVNMLSGLKSVEQDQKDLMYAIAATPFQIYKKLMLPHALPQLFSGLKIAAPMAVTASILVDMLGSKAGIGVRMLYALYSNTLNIFWASVALSALMGITSFYVVVFLEKICIPWQSGGGQG